jgi:hypothetical protein
VEHLQVPVHTPMSRLWVVTLPRDGFIVMVERHGRHHRPEDFLVRDLHAIVDIC